MASGPEPPNKLYQIKKRGGSKMCKLAGLVRRGATPSMTPLREVAPLSLLAARPPFLITMALAEPFLATLYTP